LDPISLNKTPQIAIAGTLPPPIGGVTIHVKRLIEHLEQHTISYLFYDKSILDILNLLFKRETPNIVHIHHSNAFMRWILICVLKLRKKNTIITIHRNLDRETGFRRIFTNHSIQLCSIPIVLNHQSFEKAIKLNHNSKKISPFIPPQHCRSQSEHDVCDFIKKSKTVFCTNAYDLAYDNSQNEIYQISELVNLFSQLDKDIKLIISDPSGNNYHNIKSTTEIPENILFIPKPHNFINIILQSDCLIRATTTDGDSISIKEALYYGVNVIASDCVDRPSSCTLFKTKSRKDLIDKILKFEKTPVHKPVSAFPQIVKLYQSFSQLS